VLVDRGEDPLNGRSVDRAVRAVRPEGEHVGCESQQVALHVT